MRDCDDGCRQRLQPGNKEQGYVLRKLLRRIYKMGGTLDHPFFRKRSNARRGRVQYLRLRHRYAEMSPDWWFDTHGIDLSDIRETMDE